MAEDEAERKADALLLLETVDLLPQTLSRLNACSTSLPSDEDFHFYSNFSQFKDPILGLQARVENLLSQISSACVIPKAPSWSSDPEDSSDWLVGVQDEILEQVDSAFDLFKQDRAAKQGLAVDDDGFTFQQSRKKRRREVMNAKEMQAHKGGKGSVEATVKGGRKAERCPIPFHIWSVPRPQERFDVPVNNSNTPFKHPEPRSKFNVDPLATPSAPPPANANEAIHPLEEELRSMDFTNWLPVGTICPRKPESLAKTPFTFVDSPAALKDLAAKLLLEHEIAVDLENHQFRSFQGLTCLMQISTRLEDFIIDTLELRSVIGAELREVFANPTIQKVIHGADWDILWLQRDFGIYVCNLFDTGQASRVLGMQSYSLLYLLEDLCGVIPDKRYQMADWRLRPLPEEMLKYAREDTHYLLYVGDLLKQMLVSTRCGDLEGQEPLLEVYKRSKDICLKRYEKEITTETSYLQVYGLHERKFQPDQFAVLAGLYSWRDQVARTEDESTGYVLPKHLLLKLAEEMPDDVKKLRYMLTGRHPLVTRNVATIVDVIRKSKLKASEFTDVITQSRSKPKETTRVLGLPSALKETSIDDSNLERKDGEVEFDPVHHTGERASTENNIVGVEVSSSLAQVCSMPVNNIPGREINVDAEDAVDSNSDPRSLSITETTTVIKGEKKSASSSIRLTKQPSRGLASMFSKRPSRQLEAKGTTISKEDPEQVEARLKAEKIRASISLRFGTFNELDISHHTSDYKEEEQKAETSKEQMSDGQIQVLSNSREETLQTEELILFKTDISELVDDGTNGETSKSLGFSRKGIGMSVENGCHRLWWPDVCSATQSSPFATQSYSDNRNDETTKVEAGDEMPLSITEKYWHSHQRNDALGSRVSSSRLRDSFSAELSSGGHNPDHEFSEQRNHTLESDREFDSESCEERSIPIKPFDYAAAKKALGYFGGVSNLSNRLEGPKTQGPKMSKQNSSYAGGDETCFDPLRGVKEFKSEGISPGKRRQVFPQTGNRTGIFK